MAKIKHTKNELKAQKDALKRFTRFLPMLQLKKQQLQIEIQQIDTKLAAVLDEERVLHTDLERWLALFAEEVRWEEWLAVEEVVTSTGNIAGVNIPVFEEIRLRRPVLDPFATPAWADDAQEVLAKLLELKARRRILDEQRRLIAEELRTTSQRVNLFEKVKIPECRENIRVISIFLGDEQTAAVARGKIAKGRQAS